jgi:hypothetical protein
MSGAEMYKELSKTFPNTQLPDYRHYPKSFAWYVRLYKFYKMRDGKFGNNQT